MLVGERALSFYHSIVPVYPPRSFLCAPTYNSFLVVCVVQWVERQQILPTLDFFYLPDCLHETGLDRTYHAHRFIFSFTF